MALKDQGSGDGRPDHRRLDCGGTQTGKEARIKAGETPAGWEDKPAKRRQKDVEARWTKKHGAITKNHVNFGTWCGAIM